jgi:hypothetical protein
LILRQAGVERASLPAYANIAILSGIQD